MTPLDSSYERCRELNKRHGKTYYWSTFLLPKPKRPHVHALYGFCRYADDIVDEVGRDSTVDERAAALSAFSQRFFDDLVVGHSPHPVLAAVVDTVRRFDIDHGCFERFLRSMAMDLTISSYETIDDLLEYMEGSAAVIGEMMLPILEPFSPEATPHARDLGNAFQLTNFLRDIDEDLDRGRVYLPQEDVHRFRATEAIESRTATPGFVELIRFEIARARDWYTSADKGIALLPPASARCVRAARVLYSRILDRIEAQGCDVFAGRAHVPAWEKAAVAAQAALLW